MIKTPSKSSKSQPKQNITSRISPFLMGLAYPLFRYLVLPVYFTRIEMTGQDNLPHKGAVILAPTHRSRWDPLLVSYAAGRLATGRDLRFMVTIDEMKGLQGWFLDRLGCFPVNTRKRDVGSLRHGIELLEQQRMLVIFPEGNILEASEKVESIRSGLAYIGLQAKEAQPGLNTQIVPISIRYDPPVPCWRSKVSIMIGEPLALESYCRKPVKDCAKELRDDLQERLQDLHSRNSHILDQGRGKAIF
jgi:1-acyl-sn-glycerol-3-phosphate acyltransferase